MGGEAARTAANPCRFTHCRTLACLSLIVVPRSRRPLHLSTAHSRTLLQTSPAISLTFSLSLIPFWVLKKKKTQEHSDLFLLPPPLLANVHSLTHSRPFSQTLTLFLSRTHSHSIALTKLVQTLPKVRSNTLEILSSSVRYKKKKRKTVNLTQ